MLARAVRHLRTEAQSVDERRLLVVAGAREATVDHLQTIVAAGDLDLDETTLLSRADLLSCERYDPGQSDALLGQTREAVVYDAHDELRPNALGRIVGAVDGGGLVVLLTPPLDAWPDRRDGFDDSLAVPPFALDDVAGHFRTRLLETLRAHPGIAIFDADAERIVRDGLTHPAPRRSTSQPQVPDTHGFPTPAYEACLTQDQIDCVHALEALGAPGDAVVVEADRGRGKSSAAGIAAASLAAAGRDVLVTAPRYQSAAELFARAEDVLDALGALTGRDDPTAPHRLATGDGVVRFVAPAAAVDLPGDPDVVFVDEAAALPVARLEQFLDAPAVAFTTTIHGYEGAGRGFSVRFRGRLADSRLDVTDVRMDDPIRYAAGDPIEVWAFRALLLDASPAVDPVVEDATPERVTYESLSSETLLADEPLLREVFGLLVMAHYRTEPNDLARLLDAPNVAVRALTYDGHVVSVALLAREGDLPADVRADMYEGGRVAGNMLPDVLTTQLRDEAAGIPVGWRVMRIATHHAVRSRGLGSKLLADVRAAVADEVDWLGVGYGATPELLSFWRANGFRTVHLSTTRNDTSGEYSAIMLDPCSERGRRLHDRHAAWFARRVGSMLNDPLADLDPDVAREALAATDATAEVDLSSFEWRLLAGSPFGAGLYDTAPRPFRRLTLKYLLEAEHNLLDARQERLLVRKVLQGQPWPQVAAELDYPSTRICMRSLGDAVDPLVDSYGTDLARSERDRLR